ncbi:NUDIX hydrolase [Propionibacterium cyclohexanicum]|uniref:NUDIX hydrolase n=1 Tax=Propionibacterium cyclohexanicum TaxID=64702 RepID=UPI003CCC307E
MKIFELAAVAFLRGHEVLNVRKSGTDHVILPGGKIEAGESPLDCAVRETREELGLRVERAELSRLGTFTAAAANHDADAIHCTVFLADWPRSATAVPDHEIADYEWTDLLNCREDPRQAPLLIDHVLPALEARGLI